MLTVPTFTTLCGSQYSLGGKPGDHSWVQMLFLGPLLQQTVLPGTCLFLFEIFVEMERTLGGVPMDLSLNCILLVLEI